MTNKPSIPQGTRDFSAETVRKRNYIFSVIRNVFELYSFQPLETPAMENLDTLMGKYGEEGDKLIFKILNNGINNEKNIDKSKAGFEKLLEGKSSSDITERALKYDLTIPFARYVAMNHTKLIFPFRRYQIQPVWRADRPQKGRYREFTQCDADVVGSLSLLNEVELVNIYATVFDQLKIPVEIKINSRKILLALAEICEQEDKLIDITIAIDKLDKIGLEKVNEELSQRGLTQHQIEDINTYLAIADASQDNQTIIFQLRHLFITNLKGQEGLNDLQTILDHSLQLGFRDRIRIDPTLARGLNYYTGCIFEVKAKNTSMGSIGGGGRYDDLTGLFGVPNIPGVGISFGVDRIYDVLEEMNLFPADVQSGTKALFFNMGEAESLFAFNIMQQLRSSGIACELYHEATKINKQFTYAEKKNIPFVIIIGSKEIEEKSCAIKNLATGIQEVVLFEKLGAYLLATT